MGAYQTTYNYGPSSTLLPGMIPRYDGMPPRVVSLTNNSKAAQVETLQCTGTSYAVTLRKGGVSRAFSGSGFANASASAADLHDAIEADGIASGWVDVSVSTDTVTATARFAGTGEDVTYALNTNVTLTQTTAASDGAAIGFGLAVMHDSTVDQGVRPTATTAVAQVDWLAPANVNSLDYYAGAQLSDGRVVLASYLSDGTATVQEIVEALQLALDPQFPASTIVVTEDNAKLILTAEVAGTPFDSLYGSSGATALWTRTASVANVTSGFTRPIAGFAVRSSHLGSTISYSGGEGDIATEYPASGEVSVMESGVIVAETDDVVSRFDPVYVRITATGDEKVGSVRNDSDSGDCILLSGARFIEAASGTAAVHAPVRIQFDLSTLT